MFLIGEALRRQRQPTLCQYRDHTVVAKRTDHAIEGHGRDVIEHDTPLQTEPTVGGQQRVAATSGRIVR